MKAARIHRFGPPDVITVEEIPTPRPAPGQALVRVRAAGVGPWDAWIRAGKSALPQSLPLTLGSDIAGVVEATGPDVSDIVAGDTVFGVSNERFTDGYAEYSVAPVTMIARMPNSIDFVAAASLPVAGVTAWRMLFDAARLTPGQRVIVHGAGGSVGRLAVRLARFGRLHVIATASPADAEALIALGAARVFDSRHEPFNAVDAPVDAVIDLIGGEPLERMFVALRPGGRLVSAVSPPDVAKAAARNIQASFFLVHVTADDLSRIAALVDAGELPPFVGRVLPLADARAAHEMLDGIRPRPKGKIVLDVSGD